ncbi:MAG: tetratricopeptide repeat protein [Saprospiraceae bacterium]|nr:tetratricopeptide repeat protein [Saprospiraceae bacterium]MCF8251704.1 tetratricopeptide repeat protein [Saprospiraceae bacterium]MCF8281086.1 tetratricopeptide repeat protein [Bacteroidales bacterium]MCF8311758.1 tetratricopeptide repeat protein [Saprospiraceae bacterium]MCF8441792.1 tetratricopeptide repeat protein [Saprospiraceae bacterium]
MHKQLNLLLDDSLRFYQGRQLKKALNTAQIALEFGQNGSIEDTDLSFAYLLLASIYNTNGKYQNEPSFFTKANYYLEAAKSCNQLKPSPETTAELLIVEARIHLNNKNHELSKKYFEEAKRLTKQQKQYTQLVKSYIGLGHLALALNDLNGSLEMATKIQGWLHELRNDALEQVKAEMFQLFSQAYILKQDYSKSLEMSQELLQLSRKLGDAEKEVVALRNIAVVCGVKSNYKIGMQYFLEALDKCEAIGYRDMIVQIQINIGTLYAHLYNYEEAIRRYENVIKKHFDIIDAKTQAVVYNNLGNIYLTSEQPETAIGYFEKANQLSKENEFDDLMAYSLAQLSRTKIALSRFEEAATDAAIAQQMFDDLGLVNGKQINLLNLGRIAFEEKRLSDAYTMAIQAIELAQQIKDDTAEIKANKLLAMIYKCKGEFEKAFEYQERYTKIQEEFAKVQRSRHHLDMEIRHAIREKQKEIELLVKENEYQSKLIEKSKQIARQNEELLRVNDDLRQFAYIASHDLKEPLRMIGSFTQVIEKLAKPHVTGEDLDYFRYVNEGVNRMNNLLDGLLRYSTVSQVQEELTDVSLNEVFTLSMANLKIRIVETSAIIERGQLPVLKGTQQLYVQLFQNLMSNAIKFVKPGTIPHIRVAAEETAEAHIVNVTDNGIGISKANQAKIFEIFKRLHHQSEYEGTGIGLAICQKIAKRLGGIITVKSEPGEGATFSLVLPK